MITLFYWPTANNHKITIMLEEVGLPYRIHPIDITQGQQFEPDFLAINPNNRVPAMRDEDGGGNGLTIFESGAILQYLAEKSGRYLPKIIEGRYEVLKWLYWQVGGLGPMAGQNHHFNEYSKAKIPEAIERYVNETARLYRVLNGRLADREYIAESYSIADIACYPWVALHARQKQDIAQFPHLARWLETIRSRPAVQRAYELAERVRKAPESTDWVERFSERAAGAPTS